MQKVIYFDASNGVAGDMFVAALIDLGVDFDIIKKDVDSLGLDIEIYTEKTVTSGIAATKFYVIDKTTGKAADDGDSHHVHRHLSDIKNIINKSTMNATVKNTATGIFELLAQAEADAHGVGINEVHFHEVGALDAIADIVAASSAFHQLAVDIACTSPVNTGTGTVTCAHGVLPVPVPAVLNLLTGMEAYSDGVKYELATPTGVAVLKYFCGDCQNMPRMTIKANGSGAGTRDIGRPNIFRAILGTLSRPEH